jgi:tRNA-splicing endonuclease subunit Sen34
LVLLDEEVVVLLEDSIACLVDDPNAHMQPPAEQAFAWNRENMQQGPIDSHSTTRSLNKQKHTLSEESLSRRSARDRKRDSLVPHEDMLHIPPDPPQLKVEEESKPECRFLMTRQSSNLPWYQHDSHTYKSLQAAAKAGIWTFPSNPFQRARCTVFRHLWSQGYFLGTGIKFGGDFLVYPGDPLRYHSHFIATVHFKSDTLCPMEIVAHGRLGTGTRKNHLICSVDEKTQEVECFSIEWAGFG